jgi:hypothetical protein
VAAHLRKRLGIEVDMVHGSYGEFTVHVDGNEVVSGGALGFMGVLPSANRVLEHVRAKLGA